MEYALALAARGRPSPNPCVGAVIERDGEILATGYHARAGGPHAEVAALACLGGKAEGATVYVTLEPCDHHGRTGPCSEALLAAGVRRVVIGCEDPVPEHAGGARRLREHGVEVRIGVLRSRAERLIEDFTKYVRTGLPYVRMCTQDAGFPDTSVAAVDAIMSEVGGFCPGGSASMALARDRAPAVRIVVDPRLDTPASSAFLQLPGAVTWIIHGPGVDSERQRALSAAGAVLLEVPFADPGAELDPAAILHLLADRAIVGLAVYSDGSLGQRLLEGNLVDEARA